VLLLDTDVMVDLIREYQPAMEWLHAMWARREKVSLPGFVVMELVQGCRNNGEIKEVEKEVQNFIIRWPSRATCKRALSAYTKYYLSDGLGMIDSLIGQIAFDQSLPLCTFNKKHFETVFRITTVQPYKRQQAREAEKPPSRTF
jgi:predicted nucleic acid-binding protein